MPTELLNSTSANRAVIPCRAMRWIAIDALLGAASGALFGFAFGAVGLLLNAESWSIISVASYFALCGAAAGAVVGAVGAILEGDEISEPARLYSESTLPRTAAMELIPDLPIPDPTVPSHQSSHRLHHNRLINVDQRGHQATRKPSRN